MSGDIPDNDQVFVEILQKSFGGGSLFVFVSRDGLAYNPKIL